MQIPHLRFIRDIEKKEGKFIYINGKKLLNLSSNNYLNFADNEELAGEFYAQGGEKYSPGSASARLLTGTLPVYKELETLLCDMYGKDAALLFNSGYHANVGVNSSLAVRGDVIFPIS